MGISPKQVSSLPTLSSIVFCAVGLKSLVGNTVSKEELFTEDLPSVRQPALSEFQPFLVKSSISVNDIPTCFGSSPSQTDLPWRFSPGIKEIGSSIEYIFSDGLSLTAREILYHPYSLRVPSSLLPLLSQTRPIVSHTLWIKILPEETVPQWGNLRSTEQCLISILFEAHSISQKRPLEDPLHLWITDTNSREKTRKACSLREIGLISSSLEPHWFLESSGGANPTIRECLGEARLVFKETPLPQGGRSLENFEINPISHSLSFHPYRREIDIGVQILKSQEESSTLTGTPHPLEFPLHGHQNIQRKVEEINLRLGQQGFPPIVRSIQHPIAESKSKVTVLLEKSGQLYFYREFELENQKIGVWNLPSISNSFLKGLEGGIGSTTGKDHRIYAQDRKGHRRDRDLKILKHSGAFALILLETLCFALKKKSFEGKPLQTFEDFLKLLLERLGILLYEVERKAGFIELNPAPPLDRLCSKTVIDLIRTSVLHWLTELEQNTDSIFTSRGEICLEGGIKSTFQFFHLLLSKIAIGSRGLCFLKLRSSIFPSFIEKIKDSQLPDLLVVPTEEGMSQQRPKLTPEKAQIYNPVGNWLSGAQVLHALLPLYHQGIQLSYEGLPLNEMDIQDFAPEFQLVENIEISPNSNAIDWFELHPKFFFKGVEIKSDSLDRLSREGVLEFQGKIYLIHNKNLPTVKRLEAFWAKIQGTQPLLSRRKTNDTFLHLPKSQTLEILALRTTGVKVTGGKRWQEICLFYDSLDKPREPICIPTTLRAELKPYQKSGVRWLLDLYHLRLGGILADDMGLGKTIQTLAFLECLRSENQMGAVLIVVPTSLTYNWMSESTKFTPEIPIKIFQSKNKDEMKSFTAKNKNFVIISTYGLFTEHQEYFESQKWNILVFDEAQNLKNIAAKRTTASRSVTANFKICLTGTPIENHLGEFYSLLDLAVPGSLGDLADFRAKFVNPETLDPGEIRYLKLKSKPLVLRRTKAEIFKELPLKIESTIKLPFEQKQEKIYRDIALSWNEKVKDAILSQGEARSQILMLTALLRLRQACSDPASIPNVKYTGEPPKVTVLLEALEEITESGESALVFTQFLHTFERIKKEMNAHKIPNYSLHGGTPRPERERILQEFQAFPKGSVLLMTLKTGGVGLNLVKASYVFHLEPWWNPAVENQATDRAHRIGQQRPVQVYRYLMKESVEEKIEILKERKSARFNALFSSTENDKEMENSDSRLSQSDFEYLLS